MPPCLRVPKRAGQKAISLAAKLNLLDKRFSVQRDDDSLLIPLVNRPSAQELRKFEEILNRFEITEISFERVEERPKSLLEQLEGKLAPHLLASLPRSMDVIGNIVVVEIPPELEAHKRVIGEAILSLQKGARLVLSKASTISGAYRLREVKRIVGEGGTETVYKEHGCTYYLDLAKVYFSPRLSFERSRVADQVNANEVVLDMFAGVGPYAILIAKRKGAKVCAVDANPDAIRFLRRNVDLNKVSSLVEVVEGDVRELTEERKGKFDRAIMDFPSESLSYVEAACKALKPKGVIHFYAFSESEEPVSEVEEVFRRAVEEAGRTVKRVLNKRLVKQVAPYRWQVVIDASVVKALR